MEIVLFKKVNNLPILVAQTGPLKGQKWVISNEIVIGRESDCDIVILDRQVSRYHAKLKTRDSKSIEIIDLGSKNGTFINDTRVNETKLVRDGDQIKIALIQEFLFVSSDSTVPLLNNDHAPKKGFGRLLVDDHTRKVWLHKKEIIPPLSVQQFKLLQCLYEHQGEVVSREQIIQAVWGLTEGEGVTEQALDALVRRLRSRLIEFDRHHYYLFTVRGYGFRLDNPKYE
jgi:pSer/pThr/pTyr-binding forkhead associated (FHA) protein